MVYPGGKNGSGVYQTIINLMPPHEVYIEPFLGSGAILRTKHPALRNIGMDRDPGALMQFESLTAGNDDAAGAAVINGDAFTFLSTYRFTGHELVYCDPPYLHETRGRHDLYRYELSQADHVRLLEIIQTLPCRVMISGYWSNQYADALKD